MYLVSEFQFLVPPFMLYRMHGRYGGLPSWRNPAKHPTSPHGSMAAGDCSDAAVQGLCAGRGMVEARGRSCWGTAGAHRSKQRSYVRLRRNTGPKATRHPAWECWRTGKLESTESPCCGRGLPRDPPTQPQPPPARGQHPCRWCCEGLALARLYRPSRRSGGRLRGAPQCAVRQWCMGRCSGSAWRCS